VSEDDAAKPSIIGRVGFFAESLLGGPYTRPVSLLKSASTVSLLTLASRITGLVRDVLFASVFGVSALTDAFNVAFRIPNLFRRVLGEGAFMQFNDKVRGYQFTGMAAGGSVTLNLNDGATVIYSHDK